jgi:hypothetical protein
VAKKGRKGKADRQGRAPAATTVDAASEPQAEALAVTPDPAPAAQSRTWSNVLIALVLAFHLFMPLRYYLGGGGYDERFSWRMFSTLRMQTCKVKVEETIADETRAVDLNKAFQVAWIGMLERYRRAVVDKLLARRCAQQDARSVRYEHRCVDTDGSALPTTTVTMDCASGRLDTVRGSDQPGSVP